MHVVINLNKPAGITSRQAVTKVQRLLGAEKAGHAGTLDPLATGILLVCLNEATKVSRFLMDMNKQYKARVKLGERTDTYDAEGRVLETRDISFLTEADLFEAVRAFKGEIQQKPPMYSAVKIGGKTLHKLARRGIEVDRPDRTVQIYDIGITAVDLPYFDVEISCSKGTYIRSLCDDIGSKLGTGAHMTSLERTAVGSFDVKSSLALDNLVAHENLFYSIDAALTGLRSVELDESDYQKAKHGMKISSGAFPVHEGEFVKMKDAEGNLFAIGRVELNFILIERILNIR